MKTVHRAPLIRTPDQSNHVAPDGRLFTVSAPGHEFGAWDSTIRVRLQRPYGGLASGLQLRQLHVAPAGNYEWLLERALRGTITQVLEAQGGEFVIADGQPGEQGVAFWRGPWNQIATWLVPGVDVGALALRFFDRLIFADTEQGLTVTTTSAPAETVEVLDCTVLVHDVGFVSVYPAERGVDLVPRTRGAKVPAGEVWAITSPHPETPRYLLATETAVMVINPHERDDKAVVEEKVRDFLDGVEPGAGVARAKVAS